MACCRVGDTECSSACMAWDNLKAVNIIFITSTIVWPQVNSREGTQLYPSPENWIKDLLNMTQVGKTTRSFRYDLNHIPYDYTVEVSNRFKGLDLIECLMNDGQRFVKLYRRQGARTSPWKRNAKKQNGCWRRPYK